ncbi:MAG: hypothetical protein QOE26_400 [Verrucomicrobiota bacterium]|jgi:hypothetical protein
MPNENKISDGYRARAPIEVEVFRSWENVIAQRVAVRCILWLDHWLSYLWNLVHIQNPSEVVECNVY